MKVINQTVSAPVITNCLYLAIFGVALRARETSWEGITYMQFLVPGLVMMGLVQNAYQNSSSSIIISKYQETINNLLVVPMAPWEISLAFILAGAVRGIIVGTVTFLTALIFVTVPIHHPLLLLMTSVLIGSAFSGIGAIVAVKAKDFDEIARYQNFILQPLIFLGGVFFAVRDLPANVQFLAYFNPIFYLTDIFRYSFLGVGDLPTTVSFTFLVCLVTVVTIALTWVFKTGKWLRS